MIYFFILQLNL